MIMAGKIGRKQWAHIQFRCLDRNGKAIFLVKYVVIVINVGFILYKWALCTGLRDENLRTIGRDFSSLFISLANSYLFLRIRCWNDVVGAQPIPSELPLEFVAPNYSQSNDSEQFRTADFICIPNSIKNYSATSHTQTIQRHRCVFTDGRVATLTEFITISFRLRRLRRWGEEGEKKRKKSQIRENTNSHFSHYREPTEARASNRQERENSLCNSHQVCLFRPADLSAADERKEHKTKRMIYCTTWWAVTHGRKAKLQR